MENRWRVRKRGQRRLSLLFFFVGRLVIVAPTELRHEILIHRCDMLHQSYKTRVHGNSSPGCWSLPLSSLPLGRESRSSMHWKRRGICLTTSMWEQCFTNRSHAIPANTTPTFVFTLSSFRQPCSTGRTSQAAHSNAPRWPIWVVLRALDSLFPPSVPLLPFPDPHHGSTLET